MAKLKKQRSTKQLLPQAKPAIKRKNLFDNSKQLQKKVQQGLEDAFGILTEKNHLFIATKNKVYLTSQAYMASNEYIYIEKTGIPIYEIGQTGNWIPTHHLGNILGHLATKNTYTMSDEEADLYSKKQDLQIEKTT
jgi:NOL1/NOP2/fmu family ribosome biogenesis protein